MSDLIVSLVLLGTLIALLLLGLTLLVKAAVDIAQLYAPARRKPQRPRNSGHDSNNNSGTTDVERAA